MATSTRVFDRLRQPEYTGENRCVPCTAVNLVIAAVGSVVIAIVGWQLATPTAGGVLAVAFFGLSALSIYFRGYLVPGTPTLTKRYFPAWLLARFDKEVEATTEPATPADGDGLDPEAVLTEVGALEECADGVDLCLTDSFRSAWYDAIDEVRDGDAGRERLLSLIEADDVEVEIEEFGQAFRARIDGRVVGTWQSEAAYLADLGSATVLADRYDAWDDLAVGERGRLLNGLRLFIDRCPSCGDVPQFGTETVESCCSTHEVAAVECDGCGARLFETRA